MLLEIILNEQIQPPLVCCPDYSMDGLVHE